MTEMKNWTIRDPLDESTKFGPMARSDLANQVHLQVIKSVAMGAKLLTGGTGNEKFKYPPTLLVNVTGEMPVFSEEVFGPVIAIAKVNGENDAVKLANNSEYGLGAVIFSRNTERVKREIVPQIQCGMVFVNENVKSMVQVPFGGIKASGVGRELGIEGIKEFCNVKTVYIG